MSEQSFDIMLRPMDKEDVPDVMVVEHLAYSHPWNADVMYQCLQNNHYYGWVLESRNEIQGYLFLSVAAGEMHILNICIHPDLQSKGWGRELLKRTFDLAVNEYQATICFLEVRPSNTTAISLYESEGFNEIGRRKNYYPAMDGHEDAIVMAKNIIL